MLDDRRAAPAFTHVGQQPIVDLSGRPIGHELLFRATGDAAGAAVSDGDAATAEVLISTFLDFGLSSLVGDGLAFVNMPRAFLVGDLPLPFPPGRVVLEVLEDVPVDPEVLSGVARLRAQGHAIALDDVTAQRNRAELLHLADFVKIDLMATDPTELAELVRRCVGPGRRIIAEKVETTEQRDLCAGLGVQLFQGYLTGRPQTLTQTTLMPGQHACLNLLALLCDPEVSVADVVTALQADPSLTVKVLQVARSAAAGPVRPPGSILEAVIHVGLQTLQAWTVVMGLRSTGDNGLSLTTALSRARMCQLLCDDTTYASWAFLTGLLSGVTEVLGVSAQALLAQVLVARPVREALLDGEGPLGEVLAAALAYEHGRCEPVGDLRPDEVRSAFLSAWAWSAGAVRVVAAASDLSA